MRIVSFSNTYRPTVSGVVTSIDSFKLGLLSAGHDVHIIAPEYSGYRDAEPYIYRLPSLGLPGELNFSLALPSKSRISILMEGIKPHIIHCQHPFLTGDLAATFAQDMDIPLVYTFHSRYDIITHRYIPAIADIADLVVDDVLDRFFVKCALIIAPTPTIKNFIIENYNPKATVQVIPTPVNLDHYCNEVKIQQLRSASQIDGKQVLLYIGRLAREKNLDFLLTVFALIHTKIPETILMLVGGGPDRERLENLAEKLKIRSNVVITGFVDHDVIGCYASLADVFVFPSDSETQGLVLLEAMAAGVPAVAVKAPGCEDVLTDGGGLLVPLDEQAFSDAVIELLSDRNRRMQLSHDALITAARYSLPVITDQLIEAYELAIVRHNALNPNNP